jgi:hypothetical protein
MSNPLDHRKWARRLEKMDSGGTALRCPQARTEVGRSSRKKAIASRT